MKKEDFETLIASLPKDEKGKLAAFYNEYSQLREREKSIEKIKEKLEDTHYKELFDTAVEKVISDEKLRCERLLKASEKVVVKWDKTVTIIALAIISGFIGYYLYSCSNETDHSQLKRILQKVWEIDQKVSKIILDKNMTVKP